MTDNEKMLLDIKWATRQRLQYIEIMAFYTGLISRSDVARAFGISDAAATKDLKLYGDLAPDNLIYKHSLFGFVPAKDFESVVSDLSPDAVLPMIASNLTINGGPYGEQPIYGVSIAGLPLPRRLPDKQVLAQIMRAIRHRQQLRVVYHSLSDRDSGHERIIEPHAIVNTGLRWHIRAYATDSYDFRDFVLSRFSQATMLEDSAESDAQYDDDWTETLDLALAPHPHLDDKKRYSLLLDYAATDGVITISVRRALIAYLLQMLSVDTTADHSLNPNAYQLVIVNRDEIEPFAGWAFR